MTDPFDILRAHDPVDYDEIEAYARAHATDVKQRIVASPRLVATEAPAERRRRPWRRAVAVAASVAVVAAAAFVVTRPAERTDAITCYEDVSLDGERVGLQPGELDINACAAVWAEGTLVNDDVVAPGSVPPLTGCVDEAGAIAVFPTADAAACGTLGLVLLDDEAEGTDAVVAVRRALTEYIAARSCVSLADAAAEARAQLDQAGLDEWTVSSGDATGDRTCASFATDDATMTIVITPVPET